MSRRLPIVGRSGTAEGRETWGVPRTKADGPLLVCIPARAGVSRRGYLGGILAGFSGESFHADTLLDGGGTGWLRHPAEARFGVRHRGLQSATRTSCDAHLGLRSGGWLAFVPTRTVGVVAAPTRRSIRGARSEGSSLRRQASGLRFGGGGIMEGRGGGCARCGGTRSGEGLWLPRRAGAIRPGEAS